MKTLHIAVRDKVATYLKRGGDLVCENSDYQIVFTFDAEWDKLKAKTARFIWNGEATDVEFTGTIVTSPIITDADQVSVGVFAGDLHTTTPAIIPCQKSILCGDVLQHRTKQEKSVTITTNGTTEVTPDDGKEMTKVVITADVDGGQVTEVSTAVDMDEKLTAENVGKACRYIGETTDEYISGDIYIVKEDSGVYTFEHYNSKTAQEKTATENGEVTPDDGKYLSKVTVNVPSEEPTLLELTVTENGVYTPPDTEVLHADGFSKVTVNVQSGDPVTEEKTITENGEYTPAAGVDGFSKVTVNVQSEEPVTEEKTITENGEYTPAAGVDGFSKVTVNVPASAQYPDAEGVSF